MMNSTKRVSLAIFMMMLLVSQQEIFVKSESLFYKARLSHLTEEWITLGKNAARQSATSELIIPPLIERWRLTFPYTDNQVLPFPIAAKGKLFVTVESGDVDKSLLALDPHTGEIIWYKGFIDGAFFQSATYDEAADRLYAATNYEILVFDPNNGTQLDRFEFPKPGSCGVFGLIAHEGYIYGSICDLVVKYDLMGNILWSYHDPYNNIGVGMTSPVLGDGLLYVGGINSHLQALDPQTGEMIWEIRTPGDPTGGIVFGDGMVFVGCVGVSGWAISPTVLGLDAKSGHVVWSLTTGYGGSIYASMSFKDGVLYVGSLDQYVYAVDVHYPRVLWATETQNDVYGNVLIADNIAYAMSIIPHTIYAMDSSSGIILWQKAFDWPVWHILPYEGHLFVTSGFDLIGLESTQALRGIKVTPPSFYIRPGEEKSFILSFKSSYNYPERPADLSFSSLPDGLSIHVSQPEIYTTDSITITVTTVAEFDSFGVLPLTIHALIDEIDYSEQVNLFVWKSLIFLPNLQK